MGRRSHTQTLDLWMNGQFVGTWSTAPNSVEALQYAPEWVESPAGRPLSLSLPFQPGNPAHRGDVVRGYFENLLPDSKEIRERVARRFGVRSVDAFELLAQIGRDCVGALQIMPAGTPPDGPTAAQGTPLSTAEVAAVLRGTVAAPQPHDEADNFRISMAGAQEKTALLYFHGQWCQPRGSTPTTHIFKLPMGLVGNRRLDLSTSVENEYLCALILHEYGLPVAHCEPMQFEDMKALVVKRFDRAMRTEGDSQIWRLPQEDMCQALGVPPHRKYESDGGPGIDRILELLGHSTHRAADKLMFFQAQVLFWMLCATDGHAKNFSIFTRPGGRFEMTPLYDVLSAYPLLGEAPDRLSPFEVKMAMAVRSKNAHWKIREIQRRHWEAVGARHGIVTADGEPVQKVLDGLCEQTPGVIERVRRKLPKDFPEELAQAVFAGLKNAATQLQG